MWIYSGYFVDHKEQNLAFFFNKNRTIFLSKYKYDFMHLGQYFDF